MSFGMKIFGNEMKYVTLNGETEIREALQEINPLNNLQKILSGKVRELLLESIQCLRERLLF